MLKVVEAFSGIGSQAKALENLYIDHEILYTVDWDINAIIAYDLIHNGKQNLAKYEKYNKDELLNILSKYISPDVNLSNPPRQLINVDLPLPLLPYIPIKPFLGKHILTFSIPTLPFLYFFIQFFSSIILSPLKI